ncbi:hypothetical protein VCHENC02_3662A, partial [Vibrio harveyi]
MAAKPNESSNFRSVRPTSLALPLKPSS